MDVTISGKGIDVTPAIRSYIENKLKKVERIVPDVMDVQVILSVQKHLQIVDFTIKTRHSVFTSTGSTTDMYASINEGLDNLLKQAKRQRKKVQSVKGRKRMEITEMLPDYSEDTTEKPEDEPIHRERMPVKPMSLEEAVLQLKSAENGFLLFRNSTTSELSLIFRRKDGSLGLIETNQ
jgi:putative sigma-54 modulation protein